MLLLVYVLWGSTSPAMKLAVATVPPYWMAAIRFVFAGSILWAWCRFRGIALPKAREWRDAAITGIVLLVIGNATYAWALQFLPSGIGALVFALSPLWMAVFAFALYRDRLSWPAWFGLALGLAGMMFLYSPAGGQRLPGWPTVLALATSLVWGFGSILQRRLRGSDVVQTSAMQMLSACAASAIVALVLREPLSFSHYSPVSLVGIGYLVVFGSIVGFSAYLWLLNNVDTALASTYAYVNPIVSLCIGIGFLHEAFSWNLLGGSAFIVAGVALMILAPKPTASL